MAQMAVSTNWEPLVVGIPVTIALPFGVYIRAPDFWKLPYELREVILWIVGPYSGRT